jgi:polyhydroxyalkanoate synthesis regulator phasin
MPPAKKCSGCKELELEIKKMALEVSPVMDTYKDVRKLMSGLVVDMGLMRKDSEKLSSELITHMKEEKETFNRQRIERWAIFTLTVGLVVGFVVWTNQNITELKVDVAKIQTRTK